MKVFLSIACILPEQKTKEIHLVCVNHRFCEVIPTKDTEKILKYSHVSKSIIDPFVS